MASQEGGDVAHRLLQRLGPWHCCVKRWASQIPTELALVWLNGQGDTVAGKTYEELDFEATKLALTLKKTYGCQARDCLILCYPPGLDFVVAFIACQMLGVVAVPVYFPTRSHRQAPPHSLLVLVKRTKASHFLLTSSSSKTLIEEAWGAESTGGTKLSWIFSDEIIRETPDCGAGSASEYLNYVGVAPTDVAFMQFSSGSTKAPKGCLITQAGLLHNIHHNWHMSGIYCSARKQAIYDIPLEEYAEFTEDFQSLAVQRWGHRLRFVSWLPVTHDMGLVGMIGVPLFFGCTAYFMSPLDFLKNPPLWLAAFSRHQCSITAAPDFAYALASRKVRDDLLKHISFKKSLALINGAETIRQRTLELFASVGFTPVTNIEDAGMSYNVLGYRSRGCEIVMLYSIQKFGGCGFEPWMMCPAYGLAENTVGVTGRGHDGPWPRAPRVLKVRRDTLYPGDVVCPNPLTNPSNDTASKSLVGCGCTHGDVVVKIVHPDTLEELPEWHVGEVWVSSPSCALAYFGDPDASAVTFGCQLKKALQTENTTLTCLRTGDLGLLGDGELYITGRIKNVLIVRGKNYYLQDFEEVLESCSYIRKGCVMAFALRGAEDSHENLGVAAEVERSVTLMTDLQNITKQMRKNIFQVFQVPVHSLWLVKAGTLPKTTSGKPRRHAARDMLEQGSCQGVLYCSVSCQLPDAFPLTLPQYTPCCKASDSPEKSVGEVKEINDCSAALPCVKNTFGADARQMTAHPSDTRSVAKRLFYGSEKLCREVSVSVESVVLECFKEIFESYTLPIDNETPLEALGINSLSAVELGTALTEKLNVKVEPFAFFDCPNVGSVVAALEDSCRNARPGCSPEQQLTDNMQEPQCHIYITGMACNFPQECTDPTEFWTRLLQEYQFIAPPPPERHPRVCNHPTTSTAWTLEDKLREWQGGMIKNIDLFDNNYFGISAAEATAMDPQQRLLLMQVVEALHSREGSICTTRQTGVYVGCCSEDWKRLIFADGSQAFTATAQSSCMLANRVSYCLNFTGPSLTVDTACSSSLVALHCAWQEMTSCGSRCCNAVETAVVAAVNLMLVFDTTLALQRSGFLSPSYRCRTFDAAADGFVRSEGAAAVVLERIPSARGCEADSTGAPIPQDCAQRPAEQFASSFSRHDELAPSHNSGGAGVTEVEGHNADRHQEKLADVTVATECNSLSAACTKDVCVTGSNPSHRCAEGETTPKTSRTSSTIPRKAWCRLVSTAVVHGGKTASVTAPCCASQEQLYKRTLSLANTTPDEICYIETHGTGTVLGDPTEVAAIVNVFESTSSSRRSPLILGAVKTNIGHLEGAAGMAGLLKCALCLSHHKVPANLHLKTINPYIDFRQLPAILPCKTMPLTLSSELCSGEDGQGNTVEPTHNYCYGMPQDIDESRSNGKCRVQKSSPCIVTALGFGGTYAQALLQSLPQNDQHVVVKSTLLDRPKNSAWSLSQFDHQSSKDLAPQPSRVFPAYLWYVSWESITHDDMQERSNSLPWAVGNKTTPLWLVVTFREVSEGYWKTLGLRDVHLIVCTLGADVSEESLQCLLQSKAWQVILFVEGVHVGDISTAMEDILLSLRLIPLCGKLLLKIHPLCKMLLLTSGSQLIPKHANSTYTRLEDAPPYAAGMLGFTRACRAELSYSTGKSPLLYFIDLDPAIAVHSSVRALADIVQRLKEDEVDIAIRHGKVYAPRLWSAGPLPIDSMRNPKESSIPKNDRKTITPRLHVEESAIRHCSNRTCPLLAGFTNSTLDDEKLGTDGQLASHSSEELAPCACRVRLMSLGGDSIGCTFDKRETSTDILLGCSGIVIGVGDEVHHLRVGDAVCGFAPSHLRNNVHVSCSTCSHLLQHIPPSFSFEAAAVIPTQLAEIMRLANHGVPRSGRSSSTSSCVVKTHCDSLDTKGSRGEPFVEMLWCVKKSDSGRGIPDAYTAGEREAERARAAECNNKGSHLQLHDRPLRRELEPSEEAANPCGLSRQVIHNLQPSAYGSIRNRGGGESADGCASKHLEIGDDEMRYSVCIEKRGATPPGTLVVDKREKTSEEINNTYTRCPPIDIVIVDGSGAGLLSAIYLRSVGYDVVGLPLSPEQRYALEALNIRVLVAEGAAVEQGAEDFATLKSASAESQSSRSDTALTGTSRSSAIQSLEQVAVGAAPGISPASAAQQVALSTTENGTAVEEAPAAGGRLVGRLASPGTTAAKETVNACGPGTGPVQFYERPVEECFSEPGCFPGKQSVGEVAVATDAFICPNSTTAVYCTLRSREDVNLLLPWMAEGSALFDFSCSHSPEEMKEWLYGRCPGVKYWNCATSSTGDASVKVLPLGDALRDACDVLREAPTCYTLLELHVFPDIDLDKGATLQEACNYSASGAYAGSVVCSYSNSILYVASAFIGSPVTHKEQASCSAPVSVGGDSCRTAEGEQGNIGELLVLEGKGCLHSAVTARDGQEVCGQLHSNVVADSPAGQLKCFHVPAGSMGETNLSSAEERRRATYIVAGGPSGLSAAVAHWLVEEGALYVVLLHCEDDRSRQMGENIDFIWAQDTKTVARTVTLSCCLQSKESIKNAFQEIREVLRFPPLRGIFHVQRDIYPELTDNAQNAFDDSRFVLEQKAQAAWNFHYALEELQMEDSLQLFVLFSGISGLFGSIQREAACAANTTLDMLALYRSRQGLSGLSIQWAPWLADTATGALNLSRSAEIACESEPLFNAWLYKGGISGVSGGLQTLRKILALHLSGRIGAVVACFGADGVFTEAVLTGRRGWMPKFTASPDKQRVQTFSADARDPPLETLPISDALTRDDMCFEHEDILYELVYKEVSSMVEFHLILEKNDKLSPHETMSSLGMDSLTAAELKYELQSRFRVEFDSQMAYQSATIETIASSIFSCLCSRISSTLSDGLGNSVGDYKRDSIAIVSMALRLPGGCCCPGTLWGMLLAGTDCSRVMYGFGKSREDIPAVREQYLPPLKACYLERADMFDSDLFGLHLSEALLIDRQSRLLLAVAYEALFNINTRDPQPHSGLQIAVYATGSASEPSVGIQEDEPLRMCHTPLYGSSDDSHLKNPRSSARLQLLQALSRSQESLPGLVSYLLSLSGVSMLVKAGGASSLSALCLAADHLISNTDAEAALVGAVRVLPVGLQNSSATVDTLRSVTVPVTTRMGRCCGLVDSDESSEIQVLQGEGAMAVVLQKERLAQMRANPILAVIRGRSMKHVGRRAVSTWEEGGGCAAVVRSVLEGALASAGAARREVGLIEVADAGFSADAHNPEWEAIAHVYGQQRLTLNEFPVVVSSIKGNVGCLREAAGLAGLLKVVLMLAQSRSSGNGGCVVIPPSLGLQHIHRSTRITFANGSAGILLPCKRLVRRRVPADTTSDQDYAALSVACCSHVSAEVGDNAKETLSSAATERRLHLVKGGAGAATLGNISQPSEDKSFATRTSLESVPGYSVSPSPCGPPCWSENGIRDFRENGRELSSKRETSTQKFVSRYKREDRFLGGVTALATSGLVVHVLVEGAEPAANTPVVSRTEPAPDKNSVHSKQKQSHAARSHTRSLHHLSTRVAPVAPPAATRSTYNSSAAASADGSVPVPATGGCCASAVGSSKRCLWLFSDDYTNALYCGRSLYLTSKIFAQELDRCSGLMRRHLPASLRQLLYPTCEAELLVSETQLRQPHVAILALFALQWSLANYLRQTAQGRAIAVTGVGVGETVAAAVAGLLPLEEAIHLASEMADNRETHTHTNDAEAPPTLPGRKVSLEHVDGRGSSLQLSFLENHRSASVDYGLSTDGEQTYRSDCLSVCDSTDASCRSALWKPGAYLTSQSGEQHSQHELARFGSLPLSLRSTEQLEQKQHRSQQLPSFVNHTFALSATGFDVHQDTKPCPYEQAAAVEAPTCRTAPMGSLENNLKEGNFVFSDAERRRNSGTLSLCTAPYGETVGLTSVGVSRTTLKNHESPHNSSEATSNVDKSSLFPGISTVVPEDTGGPGDKRESSRAAQSEVFTSQVGEGGLTQGRRKGSCCLPTSSCATLPCGVHAERGMCNEGHSSTTPAPVRRGGSLVDLNMADACHRTQTAAPCTPLSCACPHSSSNTVLDAVSRSRTVRDVSQDVDIREGRTLRAYGGRSSTVGGATALLFPQTFTPTSGGQRLSLQHATPVHSRIFNEAVGRQAFTPTSGGRRLSLQHATPAHFTVFNHAGGTPRFDSSGCLAAGVRGACLDKRSGLLAAEDRVKLQENLGRALLGADRQNNEVSSSFQTISRTDFAVASSHEKSDSGTHSFPTSAAERESFSEARPSCLQCEEIRNIVGKVSVSRATCVFLSAALGTAAPDRLLRDPTYWRSKPHKKLRLRATVKVAKKVLRTASVVLIGPPGGGMLQPASLLKLAKHVEILRFSGRSDSLEAVIPCEASTSTERAATVCTDIALRVPFATPCWKHSNAQPQDGCKLRPVRLPSTIVRERQQARRTLPRGTRHAQKRCSVAHPWTSLSD